MNKYVISKFDNNKIYVFFDENDRNIKRFINDKVRNIVNFKKDSNKSDL